MGTRWLGKKVPDGTRSEIQKLRAACTDAAMQSQTRNERSCSRCCEADTIHGATASQLGAQKRVRYPFCIFGGLYTLCSAEGGVRRRFMHAPRQHEGCERGGEGRALGHSCNVALILEVKHKLGQKVALRSHVPWLQNTSSRTNAGGASCMLRACITPQHPGLSHNILPPAHVQAK